MTKLLVSARPIILALLLLPNSTSIFAQTSGPVSPEAASFEPFDMTDIVNLQTGDFVYNIPLFEVPGPGGGFPISLSYHAGIMPTEEASWVGLGWTLNPGAINRTVSGFADDYYNASGTTRQFWSGGVMTAKTYSVNVQFPGIVGVNANLTVSQDTYKGTRYGYGAGVSLGYNDGNVRLGVGMQVGKNPYTGSAYMSVGANAGIGLGNVASAGIGIQYSTANGLSGNVGINSGFASVGTNISSQGTNTSFSFLGSSVSRNVSNRNSGNIRTSTSSSGFTVSAIVVSFSFKKETTRYWIDAMDEIKINGILHLNNIPEGIIVPDYFDNQDFDVYTALELDHKEAFELEPEPDATLGGTYPDYDAYQVLGQGISGNIRPFIFQGHLNKRNKFTENEDGRTDYIKQLQLGVNRNDRTHFRFINDFSNDMLNEHDEWQLDNWLPKYDFNELNERYGFRDYQLSGSKHVEHYTNKQITDGIPGFLEANATGFNRSDIEQIYQIGGFTVTNESGVTYHYSLPAYTRDEYQFSKKRDESKGLHYNHFEKREPYAYTWHLTAMTGPDYVDRGAPGLDDDDWGYWVEFEYGKWTEHFAWRNPGIGFNTDIDQEFDSYSEGQKEVYYLDAVRTKSHTAYFVKEIREDAKSNTYVIKHRTHGGIPRIYQNKYHTGSFEDYTPENEPYCYGTRENGQTVIGRLKQYKARPVRSLKLNKIILVENDQRGLTEPVDKSNGIEYKQYNGGYWDQEPDETITGCDFSPLRINYHLYQNVLDVYDLERMIDDGLVAESIKSVEFVTDYSLVPGTPNSSKGKLTLRRLESYGIGGASYMPPTHFDYEDKRPLPANSSTYPFASSNSDLPPGRTFKTLLAGYEPDEVQEFVSQTQVGDIFRFTKGPKHHYAYIYEMGDDYFESMLIGEDTYSTDPVTQMYITNNPPFSQEAVDQWGYFKSDFDFGKTEGNETLTRRPSEISARAKDAWSLRGIKSNLGSKVSIEYESDYYEDIAVSNSALLRIKDFDTSSGPSLATIDLVDDGGDLATLIGEPGSARVNVDLTVRYKVFFRLPLESDNILRKSCDCAQGFNSDLLYDMEKEAQFVYKTFTAENVLVASITDLTDNQILEVIAPDLIQQIDSDEFEITWENTEICDTDMSCKYNVTTDGYFIVGGVVKAPVTSIQGGGIRTKSIAISTDEYSNKTRYSYSGGTTSFEPFGIVEPHYLEAFKEFVDNEDDTTHVNRANRAMKRAIMDGYHDMFINAREILPPAVMYQTVSVEESVIQKNDKSYKVPGKTEYEFQVYEKGMVGYLEELDNAYQLPEGALNYTHAYTGKSHLKDYTSRVGTLKRITHLGPDPSGGENLVKLDESQYHYLHDGLETFEDNYVEYETRLNNYNNIGVTKEVFTNARLAKVGMLYRKVFLDLEVPYAAKNHLFAVLSSKEQFPSIKIGETHHNYKTGVSTSNFIRKYDHYTGIPVETISTDSYGNQYLMETNLAYKEYSEMGPLVENKTSNYNMLTQVAGTRTWRINEIANLKESATASINKQGLVAADVQTWSKDVATIDVENETDKRWRKKSTFNWVGDNRALTGDGLYPPAAFIDFNYSNESSNSDWEKNSEITLYDYYSHPLEAVDINGSYAATKMDSDHFRALSTATNAAYEEFIFTGGEDRGIWIAAGSYKYGGGVLRQDATIIRDQPDYTHTGRISLVIPKDGKEGIKYEWTPKRDVDHTYKVSLWLHKDSPNKVIIRYNNVQADGSIQYENHDLIKDESKKSGNWYLVEGYITADNTQKRSITVMHDQSSTATTIIDDFRMQPVGSAMTAYVYDDFGRLTDVLDNNNLATHYEYNVVGQLIAVTQETFQYGAVKTKEIEYNYVEK